MRQVIQYQKTGDISVVDLPPPLLRPGYVLVQNVASVISAGTERTSIQTAQASLIGKARTRPDLVRQVLANVKREGVWATVQKVRNRLDNYKELGYSCAGKVIASDTPAFLPGDAVACAGTGYAVHAEIVAVPKNLVCKIPEGVSFEEAAFTTLGAIALQGVRQADVRVGENVAVIGLGLLGLLTVQLLKAAGCRVVGVDITDHHFALAQSLGCDVCYLSGDDAGERIRSFTRGIGTDAVIITASTKSNQPLELALEVARKKSVIVIVGVVGMNVPRSPFYEKELHLTIACSYGPGRYDPLYEEFGIDYPVGYVRWTEQRNMQAFLDLVAQKKLAIAPLITHRFDIQDALQAYDLVTGKRKESYIGILLQYPERSDHPRRYVPAKVKASTVKTPVAIGFIGAGNFAQSYLLPPLKSAGVRLRGVATSRPVNAKAVSEKFGFEYAATDPQEILADPEVDAVFIASRHDSHAQYVIEALKNKKHVFVEKPLAISPEQLQEIAQLYDRVSAEGIVLMVGFNRRFSQAFRRIKQFLADVADPLTMLYRVQAGTLPPDHWLLQPDQGGRIIGEACHFIDTMAFVAGSSVRTVVAMTTAADRADIPPDEDTIVSLHFDNGSVGTLLYVATGSPATPKEFAEIFGGQKSAVMQNFARLQLLDWKRRTIKLDGSKGHKEEVQHFLNVLLGKEQPRFSFESFWNTTQVTFAIHQSLQTGQPVAIDAPGA